MFKLPHNAPDDDEFIKRANQDPDWPENIDKPRDWDAVSIWRKLWFKFGGLIAGIFWLLFFCGLFIALIEFIGAGKGVDEPSCTQSSRGCYDD